MRLRDLLSGGDRFIARADESLALAREDLAAVDELAHLAYDPDPLIVMRACDVLEKLVRERPESVQPHKHVFLDLMSSPYWETRLQCVRAVPLLEWSAADKAEVIEALRKRVDDEQKFVRCWALDGFAYLVEATPSFRVELEERLAEFLGSGVPSMQARARKIAKRLAQTTSCVPNSRSRRASPPIGPTNS